jgi:hypothetical protein
MVTLLVPARNAADRTTERGRGRHAARASAPMRWRRLTQRARPPHRQTLVALMIVGRLFSAEERAAELRSRTARSVGRGRAQGGGLRGRRPGVARDPKKDSEMIW